MKLLQSEWRNNIQEFFSDRQLKPTLYKKYGILHATLLAQLHGKQICSLFFKNITFNTRRG